jgi:hypothetical protein
MLLAEAINGPELRKHIRCELSAPNFLIEYLIVPIRVFPLNRVNLELMLALEVKVGVSV